jgi:hypothetical protein
MDFLLITGKTWVWPETIDLGAEKGKLHSRLRAQGAIDTGAPE